MSAIPDPSALGLDAMPPLRQDTTGPAIVHDQGYGATDHSFRAEASTLSSSEERTERLLSLDPHEPPGGFLASYMVGEVFVVLELALVGGSLELVRVDLRGYADGLSQESAIVTGTALDLPLVRMRDRALRAHRRALRDLRPFTVESLPDGFDPSDPGDYAGALAVRDRAVGLEVGAEKARTSDERRVPITRDVCKEVARRYKEIFQGSQTPPRDINAIIADELGLSLSRVNRLVFAARNRFGLLPKTERGRPRA